MYFHQDAIGQSKPVVKQVISHFALRKEEMEKNNFVGILTAQYPVLLKTEIYNIVEI